MTSGSKNFFNTNLLQLQNHIKRDPTSYKDEFLQSYSNYESTLQVYLMKPVKPNKQLADLAMFMAHVSNCFTEELKNFPQQIIDILKKYSTVLNPEMRMAFCKSLMLIRSKNLIEPVPLFEVFFSLFKCADKVLRSTLYTYLVNDVKRIKTKLKNYKLCTLVQQYVFTLTKDSNPQIAKYALNLMIELYKKQIWNDAKTVNVIGTGCFSKTTKVLKVSLQFFAGKDMEKEESESESEDEKHASAHLLLGLRVAKKTKGRQKKTDRALKAIRKDKKSKKKKNTVNGIQVFSALNHIYDPQDFAEKLFKQVEVSNESFEMKLAMLDLVARLTGIHSLYINNFHTFLIKFLKPHQREVSKMLWFAAISSHEMTPPDVVEPVLKAIANSFITDSNSTEVISVGLNSVREICSRCPLAMEEDLLGDLVQYKTYKDKAVSSAAKSLIAVFREKNPQMLHRKDRGKPTEATIEEGAKARKYGEIDTKSYVPGAEVISESEEEEEENGAWEETSDEEEEEEEEEEKEKSKAPKKKAQKRKHSEDDEDESDDEEWVDVSTDEELGVDENGDEQPKVEKKKLTLAEKEQRASKASLEKIFTQDDFKRIRVEQLKKKIDDKNFDKSGSKKKTIQIEDSDVSDDERRAKRDGIIPLSAITYINKKKKQNKENRLAMVKEGRAGRDKFGHRTKENHLGSTNKEKLKHKSFQMIRHKVNKKHKRSFKDKQLALRTSLLKQKKMK